MKNVLKVYNVKTKLSKKSVQADSAPTAHSDYLVIIII
ncbi:hypothetical protein DOPI104051_02100 [Dolosigranulum pigrum]|uniref:Uncharacterized protein n=1 Tax=Dolosigranulum pigrum ATCC 51524 TaxID=883103 RepID=H3NEV1_9LACT|nr:hypothetical protein HMPREF9703_01082 [Dolosigranulum pigrum ATCC 51524]